MALPLTDFLILLCTLQYLLIHIACSPEILLQHTILRCHDETPLDAPSHNLLKLATTKGETTLDLKVDSKCRKKLLITLRMRESSKDFVPDALILVDKAKNSLTQKVSRFGLPIAVKFHQDKLLQKYPLKYLYRVNAKLSEEVISSDKSKNYTGCDDSAQASKPTCGMMSSGANGVKSVAGFCCTCQDHRNGVQQRGGQRCDNPDKSPELLTSAHCLRFSPYVYNVYELKPPQLYQKLRFEVFKSKEKKNGTTVWEKMSESKHGVEIDSENPENASGSVKVYYRSHSGSIGHSSLSLNSSSQRLLLPEPNIFLNEDSYPAPLKGDIDDQILIVPKSLMSPNGTLCDHVGTRLEAFTTQPDACRQEQNTCLKNQPFDLWKEDQGPHGDLSSRFRLKSFGNVSEHHPLDISANFTTGSLFMELKTNALIYIDIEVPVDDLEILSPGYNAFIESVLTATGQDEAAIVTQVINDELVEAEYSVDLVHCSDNITQKLSTKPQRIGSLNGKTFHHKLHSDSAIIQPVHCFLKLINQYGEPVAAREITLKPKETCVCVHTCRCVCGEKHNLKCKRMSEDNIVAAGLVSEVVTRDKLAEKHKLHAQQRSKKMFHLLLMILAFLLVLMIMGLCKGLLGVLCCKSVALLGTGYFHGMSGKGSKSLTNGDLICYNLGYFLCLPMIMVWCLRGEDEYDDNDDEEEVETRDYDDDEEDDEDVGHPAPYLGETDVDLVFTSRESEGSDDTIFERKSAQMDVRLESKKSSHKSNNVSKLPSGMSRISVKKSSHSRSKSKGLKSGRPSSARTLAQRVEPHPSATGTTATHKTHKLHHLRSLAGPGSGISETSIFVKSDPSPIHLPGSGGPQAISDSQMDTKDNNNTSSFLNFVNHISASSSKSSFGTWHRRRREQYSAYDFLPEPKQNTSFS